MVLLFGGLVSLRSVYFGERFFFVSFVWLDRYSCAMFSVGGLSQSPSASYLSNRWPETTAACLTFGFGLFYGTDCEGH